MVLTVKEVSQRLRVSADNVYLLIYNGKLKAFNVSPSTDRTKRRYWRVSERSLEDFQRANGNA